jgi:hypothetical protein
VANLASFIQALADADPRARAEAGRELYEQGRRLGESAVARWRADPEIAALVGEAPTVGVAVAPERFEEIRAANGAPRLAGVPPDQDAREFELHFERGAALDILTTRAPEGSGAIARFLERFGEGIQQVEYATPDVDRATELLRQRLSVAPLYPAARPGADGTRVNFFLVAAAGGKKALVELVESRPEGRAS